MKKLLFGLVLLFLATDLFAQSSVHRRPIFPAGGGVITFDAIGAGIATSSAAANPNWTHTVATDANYIEVCIYMRSATAPTSVTAGATTMTEFAGSPITNGVNRLRRYYAIGGPTGSVTITINMAAGEYLHANSASYKGVGSVRGTNSATGATTTPSVAITSVSGDMVTDCLVSDSFSYAAGAGQTARINNVTTAWSSEESATTTSTTMSWTQGDSIDWTIHGAALIPS